MARNIDRMSGDDFPVRGGKKKAARVLNEDPKSVVSSAKGDNARVGIPTRQPAAALTTPKGSRVGIPTRQPAAPIVKRRVLPAAAMSALARRPNLRGKR